MKNPYKEYRRRNFTFEVSHEFDIIDDLLKVVLSVAPNGRQFITISFTESEWKKIRKSVNEKFKSLKQEQPQ
jgi:hypothetical protein